MRPAACAGHPSSVPRASLALALALAALAPAPAQGGGPEPHVVGSEETPPATTPEPADEAEARGEEKKDDDESWFDVSHAYVERQIFAPVVRFDRFFSDERDLEAERSRSFVRWRNELRLEEGDPAYSATLSATLRVPGLSKQLRRLRIEIAGQTRDAMSALFPGEVEEDEPESERGRADAGLVLRLWDTVRAHASLGAGFLVQLPPGAYGRLRLRSVLPLGRRFLSRQAVTGFWRTDTRFGTSASAEIERPLSPSAVARLFGTATVTEESRGVEWTGDLALLASYRWRIGAQVGASVNGATAPVPGLPAIERYRVYTRLRRAFLRHWLYLELEPEYAWPYTPERGRHGAWEVAFRLEVQFHGAEAVAASRRMEPGDPGPFR